MLRYLAGFCGVVLAIAALVSFAPTAAAQATIDNYLGRNASVPVTALGARAKLFNRALQPITSPGANDVVVWQSPLPGDAFGSVDDARFIVTDRVPVPNVVGMRVADAEMLLAFRGLAMSVVSSCSAGAAGVAPSQDEQDMQVTAQCVPPNSLFDVGNFVGVVINPWPDSSSMLLFVALGIAAIAAAAALIFFMRARFAQQELDVFRQGRSTPPR